MLRVGIAGIGFMGWIHWLAYKQIEGVEVVAVCDSNEDRLKGDWTAIKGNFGPPGVMVDLSGISGYAKIDDLCDDEKLDLIDICLPPSAHVQAVEMAARAGRHVFCEKPLALDPDGCDRAVGACAKAGRQLLVGHVLPFFPEYRAARRVIDSGQYGTVIGGTFKRVISDPLWLPHYYDPNQVGGPLLDLHIHDAHFLRLLFGMPTSVFSSGRMKGGVVQYCNSIFNFDDNRFAVSSTSGVVEQQGRPFTHGFEIHLQRATLHFEYAAVADGDEMMPLKILTDDGRVIRPEMGDGDPVSAFVAEIKEVVACITNNSPSEILSGDLARDAVQICRAQAVSAASGRIVVL